MIIEFLTELNMSGGRINQEHLNEAFSWIADEISEQFENNLYFRDRHHLFITSSTLSNSLVNSLNKILIEFDNKSS